MSQEDWFYVMMVAIIILAWIVAGMVAPEYTQHPVR